MNLCGCARSNPFFPHVRYGVWDMVGRAYVYANISGLLVAWVIQVEARGATDHAGKNERKRCGSSGVGGGDGDEGCRKESVR